jgi:hypothetical protein
VSKTIHRRLRPHPMTVRRDFARDDLMRSMALYLARKHPGTRWVLVEPEGGDVRDQPRRVGRGAVGDEQDAGAVGDGFPPNVRTSGDDGAEDE